MEKIGILPFLIAKAYGAEVAAITSSEWKKEQFLKLGADHVIIASDNFSKD